MSPSRPDGAGGQRLRLDKWLWHARFCKTRALAAALAAAGRVRVDGTVVAKAHALVAPGMVLTFPLGPHIRVVRVLALGARRGPAAEARTLYADLDPPPEPTAPATATAAPAPSPGGRPSKRDRRQLEALRRGG